MKWAATLGITQKSAWFVLHRLRLALQSGIVYKLGGEGKHVEVDETFIGGAARFMHADERKRRITETGTKDKTAVMGILERGGEVRATVIPNRRKHALQANIRTHVKAEQRDLFRRASCPIRDSSSQGFPHEVIDHAEKPTLTGKVHTNGLENFWSLLKRGLKGTYISVEPFHLFRYLDEQAFRYNNRGDQRESMNDGDRFQNSLIADCGEAADLRGGHWQGGTGESAKPNRLKRGKRKIVYFFRFSASRVAFISECGTDRTCFSARSKVAYSPAAFLAEGFG